MLIDTHCHLYDQKAFPDVSAALQEAQDAGVTRCILVGIDTETSRKALQLADEYDNLYAVVGWHPTNASKFNQQELEAVRMMAQHSKALAIGEIGLDFYWDYSTPQEQFIALEQQLDLALELAMPVVFHCRDAYSEILDYLEKRPSHPPYLFHCFAGDQEHARRALALGCIFGVDGPVTYKSRDDLRAILIQVGLENIVIETDAPYLAPVPHRGQRNKPAWVSYVNDALAELFGITPAEAGAITTRNAERFFRIA